VNCGLLNVRNAAFTAADAEGAQRELGFSLCAPSVSSASSAVSSDSAQSASPGIAYALDLFIILFFASALRCFSFCWATLSTNCT
jgi:hypothetical protein